MSELPAGWAQARIGDLISAGGVFMDGDWIESKDQDPSGDVRLIQLADVGDGAFRNRSSRFLTSSKARELRCTFLQAGDVLVARMPDPLGRACIFPGVAQPAVTAVDVCIVRPASGGADPRWLMWAVNASQFRTRVSNLQSGTTRKRISRKNLATIELPVPPVAEQRRIVAAIEEQFSRLDAAEASLSRGERRLALLREHALDFAFVGDWSWTTLGEIAEIAGGVTKDAKRQSDPRFVEVPYLRVANVQRGFLDLREIAMIRVPPERAKALALQPGDVLFNEGGDREARSRLGLVRRDRRMHPSESRFPRPAA
jgi:type I restriction enzyme S subunit